MTSEPSDTSIRITRTGKITHWVSYALNSLQENERRPIVLHTLPSARDESNSAAEKDQQNTSNSLITVPRLISVVEIIKREYLKDLEQKRSTRLVGLHQYNEIGSLEDIGLISVAEGEGNADQRNSEALQGKNFPKQKQSPYMKITLSLEELPELVEKGATYQPPLTRKITKSAKKRAKVNSKKQNTQSDGPPMLAVSSE